ncbi:ARM repeat superfamily protein [Artemisia annua]|uniref:ARM repeat superfamily protein n=1 Tax=Artemisia annua TaxID=35608 RepID=A0A2U1M653_ARTAN|nr:ARM repeat superfamily protein [Artemisia annua]
MATSSASSMYAGKSDEEVEEILDRMLTRLALCDEPKLENLLNKLLPLTISSLSRPSSIVRTKVMEILSHVNKRVKHQQQIGLPLDDLWHLYMEDNAAPMVRNFCIVYVEMAFDRVTKEKKENIAPTMIANISKLPSQHQDIVLRIVTKVIGECHSSKISDEVAAKYRLITGSQDREIFVEFCLHTLLYQPPSASGGSPPGLSVSQSNRVTGKTPLSHDMLLVRKLGLLNVLDVMELPAELVYPIYVAACADRHEPVIRRGEELLKKKTSGVQFDDAKLINRLFLLFNGNVGAEHIAADSRVVPGNPALRVRLMSVFCRSVTAANSFPSTLQCIFGCIYGMCVLRMCIFIVFQAPK